MLLQPTVPLAVHRRIRARGDGGAMQRLLVFARLEKNGSIMKWGFVQPSPSGVLAPFERVFKRILRHPDGDEGPGVDWVRPTFAPKRRCLPAFRGTVVLTRFADVDPPSPRFPLQRLLCSLRSHACGSPPLIRVVSPESAAVGCATRRTKPHEH